MATVQELEKQIADLTSKIKYGAGRQLREREEAAAFTRQLIQQAEAAGDQAKVERETQTLSAILQEISTYKQEVAGLEAQRDQLQQELNTQKAAEQGQKATTAAQQNTAQSAGEEVKQSGNTGATNPPQPTTTYSPEGRITGGTNADAPTTRQTATGEDAGTAANTVPITQTQAVSNPPGTGGLLPDPNYMAAQYGADAKTSPYGPGVGSKTDDAATAKNNTRQDILFSFNEEILPQANILDEYASYSYQLSWYLLNEADYKRLIATGQNTGSDTGILGGQLLVQSGGKQQNNLTTNESGTSETLNRNRYFSLDYYIDSCIIKNVLPGKGNGAASSVTEMKMTIIEPNGISLIDNIKSAVADYAGIAAWNSAIYCLVIRFRGYDANGLPVLAGKTNSGGGQTDPYTVSIKYIPFAIKNIKMQVGSKLTSYEMDAAPLIYNFKFRETTPFNVEITGGTVKEILGGQVATTTNADGTRANQTTVKQPQRNKSVAPRGQTFPINDSIANNQSAAAPSVDAPSNLAAGPKGTGSTVRGLMQMLNEYSQELVKKGTYEIADEYYIEFANPSIANATLKKPGDLVIGNTPMFSNETSRKLVDEFGQMVATQRNFGITAGQNVRSAIDLVIRNSSFITEQQLKIIDEKRQIEIDNGPAIGDFSWFKINLRAEPKGEDRKRNDYAYKFFYTISLYKVKSLISSWFPRTRFNGVHKSYPYWFTGKNNAVLEYNQNYDNLYHTVLSGSGSAMLENFTSNYSDIPRFVYQPRSGQSAQGADGAAAEPAANAADYLYSPSDLSKVRVKILGDPAWIAQGEIFRGVTAENFNYKGFLADGTINFDSQQVLFEVVWQRPVDYDAVGDGLMNPNRTDPNSPNNTYTLVRNGRQSYVFYTISITSEFRAGRFEQILEGGLYIQERPKKSQQVVDRPVSASELGSQTFPTADQRPRVTAPKQASDKRRSTIASQTFPLNNNSPATFRGFGQGPSNQVLTGDKATDDLIRKSYDDSTSAGGAGG